MTLDELVRNLAEQGYTARAGTLFLPNGFQHRGVLKAGDSYHLPEVVAERLEGMQNARRERSGNDRLGIVGRTFHTPPGSMAR